MNFRHWDPHNQYVDGILKDYKHWELGVGYRQHTLGGYIVITKHESIEKITELSAYQLLELQIVFSEIQQALSDNPVFRPDRFNYLQPGNKDHSLHFHGIPRYQTPRTFAGQEWVDETFGKIPVWKKEEVSKELVIQVRDE